MGIDAAWITEAGKAKQEVFDPNQLLTSLATNRWHTLAHTYCLRFIDPWGDTVFNQGQIPHLLRELQADLTATSDVEIRAHLKKVIRLVTCAIERTHTYIKFIGD